MLPVVVSVRISNKSIALKQEFQGFFRVYITLLHHNSLFHHDYVMKDIFPEIYLHGTTKRTGDLASEVALKAFLLNISMFLAELVKQRIFKNVSFR